MFQYVDGSHFVYLKFLIIFEQGAPHFHFPLGPPTYVVHPAGFFTLNQAEHNFPGQTDSLLNLLLPELHWGELSEGRAITPTPCSALENLRRPSDES